MTSQSGKQTITIHISPISHEDKLHRLTEHNERNIFLEQSSSRDTSSRPLCFLKTLYTK